MKSEIKSLLEKHNLGEFQDILEKYLLPCISFELKKPQSTLPTGASKLGGNPDLPKDFAWSKNKGRPLDFLLQINLADASKFDQSNLLPKVGLLSFFYDLEDQPWCFDPDDLNGYKVVYSPPDADLQKWNAPQEDYELNEFEIIFSSSISIPYGGSRSYDSFSDEVKFTEQQTDNYYNFGYDLLLAKTNRQYSYGENHQILGHSENIQGDMQLEAQLVTNGLYCGDASGYNSPQREILEKDADDWILLLQLDSDDAAELMWGDAGMLYFWIKKQDLAELRFENVWMTLQCS